MTIAQHQSNSNEHYTPPLIIEAARETLGHIDLDPASSQSANRIVKATNIFTKEENGLQKDWEGRVFLNPPGGKLRNASSQRIWLEKLKREWEFGKVTQAVFIAFNLEIFRMCPQIIEFPLCLPKERIKYYSEHPQTGELQEGQWSEKSQKWTNSPSHATTIIYFPPSDAFLTQGVDTRVLHFKEQFLRIGYVKVNI